MTKRKSIGITKRFEVFKSDSFACQYCGRKPPTAILEIDHIVPVSQGGTNELHNLITSCVECNRGKCAGTLETTPRADLPKRTEMLREREEQVRAYEEMLAEHRNAQERRVEAVVEIYEEVFSDWTISEHGRRSIAKFLENLPLDDVQYAMHIACGRMGKDRAFRYFCGICWNKIRG